MMNSNDEEWVLWRYGELKGGRQRVAVRKKIRVKV